MANKSSDSEKNQPSAEDGKVQLDQTVAHGAEGSVNPDVKNPADTKSEKDKEKDNKKTEKEEKESVAANGKETIERPKAPEAANVTQTKDIVDPFDVTPGQKTVDGRAVNAEDPKTKESKEDTRNNSVAEDKKEVVLENSLAGDSGHSVAPTRGTGVNPSDVREGNTVASDQPLYEYVSLDEKGKEVKDSKIGTNQMQSSMPTDMQPEDLTGSDVQHKVAVHDPGTSRPQAETFSQPKDKESEGGNVEYKADAHPDGNDSTLRPTLGTNSVAYDASHSVAPTMHPSIETAEEVKKMEEENQGDKKNLTSFNEALNNPYHDHGKKK